MPDPSRVLTVRCCIVGGGPAGMMLGYLMGRAGIETVVLEKHADFLRDFRGDTVHPSTMQVMDELGLLDDFLKRPHHKVRKLGGDFGGRMLRVADFSRLNLRAPFIAFMPQWEFLDFLFEKGAEFPNLKVLRSTEVTDLTRDGGRVTGVVARDAQGELRVDADLVIGCDGRSSVVRARAGLEVEDIGAPIDVLWFHVGRTGTTTDPAFLHAVKGGMLITIDRGDYWQCAYVIAKGGIDAVKARGLPSLKAAVVAIAPALGQHIDDVRDWDDVKLLTVTIDRLKTWSLPGLLCIGDAAHAMSPVGGVGINLAIQDAVATANLLAGKLQRGAVTEAELDAVRQRRLFPVKVIQAVQVMVQNRVIVPALGGGELTPPLPLRIVDAIAPLQGVLARGIGMGVRPEHVTSPKA
jgi:2-polyprenyl-6-methoxyphenol hydroxylase-like FAD-dependent oxidoreductase